MRGSDPHGGQGVAAFGRRPEEASAAVILVHGRGATAESMLGLAQPLGHADEVAFLAPQAAGHSWYPYSFLAPLDKNEPHLSSALGVLERLVAGLEQRGVARERIVLAGFSQGACLASEYAARHARRWGGVAAFTGGLLGPEGTPREYQGDFAGTPVYLGSGDPDPHVPWKRVEESAAVFQRLGAEVTARRFPGMPHTVNDEEVGWLRDLLAGLTGPERQQGA
ncbi:MAG TPA: alpha/beta fold hydrolase [Thermoanaerobaculia bacterium]|nr:alpha/beta fold hydrolase [Thermoanaerobaculia bacterium]